MKLQEAKNLTQEPPRSPRIRVGNYAILGRTIDKCRAFLAGTIGDYHFDCPLDNMLFGFKAVKGDDFKEIVATGAGDDEIIAWLNENGTYKSTEEIHQWSDQIERYSMIDNPEKKDFFIEECEKLGLDPYKVTMFDWLEEDDRVTFRG